MAPSKRTVSSPATNNKNTASGTTTTPSTISTPSKSTSKADAFAYSTIISEIWTSYNRNTPQSLKLIDVFMAFLVFSGVVQFAYCILVGNYPFNAFLSGFISTVGQFVLTAGLRSQCNTANASEFPKITPERAFGDFVFSSIVLHFAVVNFLG